MNGIIPLRILMTTDTTNGIWTLSLELIRSLESKVSFALATLGEPLTETQLAEIAAFPNVALHMSNYKLDRLENPWHDLAAAGNWLMEINEQFQPDLVHLNTFAFGNLPW